MDKRMDTEERERFDAMYREFQTPLRKRAYVNDVPVDYIDDVVQDTFVAYARYDYSLSLPLDNMRMLLIKILKSRCMDFHRKMKCRSYGELDEKTYNSEDYPERDKAWNLASYVSSKERCQAIMNEIDNMPESWREVAVLKMLQGRPTKEVCAILDISEKACYSRVSRIRKYLEQLISNENWP